MWQSITDPNALPTELRCWTLQLLLSFFPKHGPTVCQLRVVVSVFASTTLFTFLSLYPNYHVLVDQKGYEETRLYEVNLGCRRTWNTEILTSQHSG